MDEFRPDEAGQTPANARQPQLGGGWGQKSWHEWFFSTAPSSLSLYVVRRFLYFGRFRVKFDDPTKEG